MSSSHLAERQGNHLANETKAIGSVAFQNPLFPKGDNDFDNSPVTTEVVAIRDLAIVSRMDRADVSSAPNFNILRNKLTAPPSRPLAVAEATQKNTQAPASLTALRSRTSKASFPLTL